MSDDWLRVAERLHGHLGALAVVALLHPVVLLRDPRRRASWSVGLATALVSSVFAGGIALYPAYRAQLKRSIFVDAPTLGWMFERKEHLAFAAMAFAWPAARRTWRPGAPRARHGSDWRGSRTAPSPPPSRARRRWRGSAWRSRASGASRGGARASRGGGGLLRLPVRGNDGDDGVGLGCARRRRRELARRRELPRGLVRGLPHGLPERTHARLHRRRGAGGQLAWRRPKPYSMATTSVPSSVRRAAGSRSGSHRSVYTRSASARAASR